ncbi:MAG: hypothetical protein ACI350_02790 [Prevotella sp.]
MKQKKNQYEQPDVTVVEVLMEHGYLTEASVDPGDGNQDISGETPPGDNEYGGDEAKGNMWDSLADWD